MRFTAPAMDLGVVHYVYLDAIEFSSTVVPEPGTWTLLALGGAALWSATRGRRKNKRRGTNWPVAGRLTSLPAGRGRPHRPAWRAVISRHITFSITPLNHCITAASVLRFFPTSSLRLTLISELFRGFASSVRVTLPTVR